MLRLLRGILRRPTLVQTGAGYSLPPGVTLTTRDGLLSTSESTNTKDSIVTEQTTSPFLSILQTLFPRQTFGLRGTEIVSTSHSSIQDCSYMGYLPSPLSPLWMGGERLGITLNSQAIDWQASLNSLELTVKLQYWKNSGSEPGPGIRTALITSLNTTLKTLKSSGKYTISLDPLYETTLTSISSSVPGINELQMCSAQCVLRIEYTQGDIESPRVVEAFDTSVKSVEAGSKDDPKYLQRLYNQYAKAYQSGSTQEQNAFGGNYIYTTKDYTGHLYTTKDYTGHQ